ncbi:DUF4231 domain-containing protein [Amnibacterium sp.]|uniref:DUF4231 domain-containing protein n=1 Tax=Amnibacterium sp. TaxID=1872496 RepID=UPI003F7B4013
MPLEAELSDFYAASDQVSLDGQRRYVNGTRLQLATLVVAALAGGLTIRFAEGGADWAGIVAAAAFACAALLRGYLWRARPDKDWYAGRAAAESAKTVAWRFSVCADPFPASMTDDEAIRVFLSRLSEVRAKVASIVVVPAPQGRGEVTQAMLELRHGNLERRQDAYLTERIEGQREWYSRKAMFNKRRVRLWATVMLVLEAAGLIGAILKATGMIDVDTLGVTGAFIAAIAAWSEMRQYGTLASAYSVTANELADVLAQGRLVHAETDWSKYVVDAEEAISREHTMWVASRDT